MPPTSAEDEEGAPPATEERYHHGRETEDEAPYATDRTRVPHGVQEREGTRGAEERLGGWMERLLFWMVSVASCEGGR